MLVSIGLVKFSKCFSLMGHHLAVLGMQQDCLRPSSYLNCSCRCSGHFIKLHDSFILK